MYGVSENYLAAVRSVKRTDRITGSITLADGTLITINDSVLVKDTLKITKELCSGRYRIGTFCLSKLRFSFFLADALGIELAGAHADLTYGIKIADGTYENVSLGRYYVDPVLSTRRKDIVTIVGFDAGVLFDREPSASLRELSAAPPALIAAVCAECGVSTDITAASLSELPNSGVAVSAGDRQIQSCRDIVMWCAAMMCGYAVIGRDGKLCIIPAKYDVEPEDPTVITVDRTIREDERESINVTDTRAYIKYLTAYEDGEVVNYTSGVIHPDEQSSAASYALEKNPLMSGLSAQVCRQANTDWLSYITHFHQRGVEACIFGDPAIDIGDTIMCRGGDVDQRAGIAGVITGIEWKYRGHTNITCLAAQCCGSLESGSVTATLPQIRKQTAKRMDAVNASASGTGKFLDSGHTSVAHNDTEHNTSTLLYDSINGYNNSSSRVLYPAETKGANLVTGWNNALVDGQGAFVYGTGNTVERCAQSEIGGKNNTGWQVSYSAINGEDNDIRNAAFSAVFGHGITVDGLLCALAVGYGHDIAQSNLVTSSGLMVLGHGATVVYSDRYKLVIGHNYANIFTVDESGNVLAAGTYGTMGADYAEYFEWADGNPDNEDRCGLLVSLDGDKIVPAQGSDILGAVSGSPSVVGGECIFWKGRYVRDIYGRPITDSSGGPVVSGSFDPARKYVPRSERPEWSPVGLVGRLIVRDDGSCTPSGHCRAVNGVACHSEEATNVRVLRRAGETHIEVLIK